MNKFRQLRLIEYNGGVIPQWYPQDRFGAVRRRPVDEVTYLDRWSVPFRVGRAASGLPALPKNEHSAEPSLPVLFQQPAKAPHGITSIGASTGASP
jgi:hypothetical protein